MRSDLLTASILYLILGYIGNIQLPSEVAKKLKYLNQ